MDFSKNTESQTTSQDSQTKKPQRLSAYYLTEEEMKELREDSERASLSRSTPFKKIIYPSRSTE